MDAAAYHLAHDIYHLPPATYLHTGTSIMDKTSNKLVQGRGLSMRVGGMCEM